MLLYIRSSSSQSNNPTASSGCTTCEHPLQSTCCMQSLTHESTTSVPSCQINQSMLPQGIKANAEFNKTQITSLHGNIKEIELHQMSTRQIPQNAMKTGNRRLLIENRLHIQHKYTQRVFKVHESNGKWLKAIYRSCEKPLAPHAWVHNHDL